MLFGLPAGLRGAARNLENVAATVFPLDPRSSEEAPAATEHSSCAGQDSQASTHTRFRALGTMSEERNRAPATVSPVLQLDVTWLDYNAVSIAHCELGIHDYSQARNRAWFGHVTSFGPEHARASGRERFEAESVFERQEIYLQAFHSLIGEIQTKVCGPALCLSGVTRGTDLGRRRSTTPDDRNSMRCKHAGSPRAES